MQKAQENGNIWCKLNFDLKEKVILVAFSICLTALQQEKIFVFCTSCDLGAKAAFISSSEAAFPRPS